MYWSHFSLGKKIWLFSLGAIGIFLLGNLLYSSPLPNPAPAILKDVKGNLISGRKSESYASIEEVPDTLRTTVIRIEDRRFYRHVGIDPIAILRASHFNLTHAGKRQWASTLPQQLVKLTQQAYQRTWRQKIKEILIAFNLSLHYSKNQLFLTYLNQVEFLNGVRGYKSACQSYFAKPCEALFPSELSFLVATAQTGKNPLKFDGFRTIKNKSQWLCQRAFGKEKCTPRTELPPLDPKSLTLQVGTIVPQFAQYQSSKKNGSWNQNSVFDLSLYHHINHLIRISEPYRKQAGIGDCCILVLDETGEIRSMNTCRPFEDEQQGQVNGCLRKRQTWSAIKPFLYTFAMKELHLTGWTKMVDEPVSYYLDEDRVYSPKNFSLKYYGEISLAQALGNSLNIPAIKLVHEVGVEPFISFLKQLREEIWWTPHETLVEESKIFNAETLWLSVGLGTYEMSPLAFAKLWKLFLPWTGTLHQRYASSREEVFTILSKNQYRILSFWLDNYLDLSGRATKSGTSRHFVDGRTCGVNREKKSIVCVRAGNYDASPMKESWILTAGYLWNLVVQGL